MKSQTKLKVRGYHLDLYGHVNNARYLEFLEEGRWNYYETKLDWKILEKLNLAYVIVNINISYLGQARLNDTLVINTKVLKSGTKSITMLQEIFLDNSEQKIVEATVTFVLMSTKNQKAIVLDDNLKDLLI